MKTPNVQIKNLKTFNGHDGIGVNANVFINGKKCFSVFDSAHGGDLEIQYYDYDQILGKERAGEYINELLLHIDTLKDINSLEDYINDLINTELQAKDDKKFEKQCMDSICFGVPDSGAYSRMTYKKSLSSFPTEALQMMVDQIKAKHCINGVVILNKNLLTLGIKI